jgi:UDP-glucuronate decarboxylase
VVRVLVAGGAGFLGSHLCESLLSSGHSVICLDNLYTGSKDNIQHLLGNPQIEFLRHDVTFPIYLEVEAVFNLACPASPIQYQRNPVQTLKTSVHGAINLLDLAKRVGAIYIQASTSEVYGDPAISPQSEEYWGNVNPIGERSCYDEGKRAAETLTNDYRRQYGVDTRIARIFNTYGPRMQLNDGRVVSNFIVQALLGEDITIYGDGSQTRSFCYVDDLIEGLMALFMSNDLPGPINLGNPQPQTMLELASRIISLTKSDSSIVYRDLPSDDPKTREPNISIAREKLSWSPKVDLGTGLLSTIAYFSKKLS